MAPSPSMGEGWDGGDLLGPFPLSMGEGWDGGDCLAPSPLMGEGWDGGDRPPYAGRTRKRRLIMAQRRLLHDHSASRRSLSGTLPGA